MTKHIAVVINNNQPGWTNIVETDPHVTLDVGTKLYLHPAERESAPADTVTCDNFENALKKAKRLFPDAPESTFVLISNYAADAPRESAPEELVKRLTRCNLVGDGLHGHAMCERKDGKWVPYDQAVLAIKEALSRPAADREDARRWIPVSERLPAEELAVAVVRLDGVQTIAKRRGWKWITPLAEFSMNRISHWFKLPPFQVLKPDPDAALSSEPRS